MFIILLSWISQFTILYTSGSIFENKLSDFNLNWFQKIIFGYAGISILALILSFFTSVNFYFQTTLLLICLPIFFKFHFRHILKKIKNNSHLILIALPILFLSIPVPNHGDSSFYHAQALQWVEKFSVVPGLANFFSRLGFNSSFFNTQAAFSFFPISDFSSRFLNGFLVVTWFTYLAQQFSQVYRSIFQKVNALVFALLTLSISRGWVSSIAPDVAVGLFMLMFFYEICVSNIEGSTVKMRYLLLILSIAISIKVSALFLLPIWFLLPGLKKTLNIPSLIFPVLLISLWLLRNVLISGYLIYPYLPLPFIELDWTIPKHLATIEKNWIISWARMPGEDWQMVLKLSLFQWMPQWFMGQNILNKLITIGFVFFSAILPIKLIMNLRSNTVKTTFNIILVAWTILIIIWFSQAPDFRFGYALILPYFWYFILVYFRPYIIHLKGLAKYSFPIFASILFSFTTYVLLKEKSNPMAYIIFPEDYPKSTTSERLIGFQKINVTEEDNCWNHPIPCINQNLFSDSLKMRGASLQDGFRHLKRKYD